MPDQMIQLTKLRKDGGTQQRAKLDSAIVTEYAERMKAGDEFPPVDVFYDKDAGPEYWLASGFHREAAAREAGQKTIRINLRKGSLRDAILFSCGANSSHGLRRSNADKRKAVTTLVLDLEWSKFSDEKIADHCCVDRKTVKAIRDEQGGKIPPSDKRIGRDGKSYPVTIKQPAKPRIETIEDEDEDTDTEDATDIHEEPEPEGGYEPHEAAKPLKDFADLHGKMLRKLDDMAAVLNEATVKDLRAALQRVHECIGKLKPKVAK